MVYGEYRSIDNHAHHFDGRMMKPPKSECCLSCPGQKRHKGRGFDTSGQSSDNPSVSKCSNCCFFLQTFKLPNFLAAETLPTQNDVWSVLACGWSIISAIVKRTRNTSKYFLYVYVVSVCNSSCDARWVILCRQMLCHNKMVQSELSHKRGDANSSRYFTTCIRRDPFYTSYHTMKDYVYRILVCMRHNPLCTLSRMQCAEYIIIDVLVRPWVTSFVLQRSGTSPVEHSKLAIPATCTQSQTSLVCIRWLAETCASCWRTGTRNWWAKTCADHNKSGTLQGQREGDWLAEGLKSPIACWVFENFSSHSGALNMVSLCFRQVAIRISICFICFSVFIYVFHVFPSFQLCGSTSQAKAHTEPHGLAPWSGWRESRNPSEDRTLRCEDAGKCPSKTKSCGLWMGKLSEIMAWFCKK